MKSLQILETYVFNYGDIYLRLSCIKPLNLTRLSTNSCQTCMYLKIRISEQCFYLRRFVNVK